MILTAVETALEAITAGKAPGDAAIDIINADDASPELADKNADVVFANVIDDKGNSTAMLPDPVNIMVSLYVYTLSLNICKVIQRLFLHCLRNC